jgi:hypothetical protein
MKRWVVVFFVLAACGSNGGGSSPDAGGAPDAAAPDAGPPAASIYQAMVAQHVSWEQMYRDVNDGCTACATVTTIEPGLTKMVMHTYFDVSDQSAIPNGYEYCHDILSVTEQTFPDIDPKVRSFVTGTVVTSTCGTAAGTAVHFVFDAQSPGMVAMFQQQNVNEYQHSSFPRATPLVACAVGNHEAGRAYCAPTCDYPTAESGNNVCAFPDYVQPPYYDWSCVGAAAPTTAPDPVTIHGRLTGFPQVFGTSNNIGGATVDVYSSGNDVGTATSGSNGSYSVSATTGGAPLDAEIRMADTGYLTSHVYYPYLIGGNASLSAFLWPSSYRDTTSAAAGVTLVSGDGAALVRVLDCAGSAIQGATVSAPTAGAVTYLDQNDHASTKTSTSSTGRVVLWNLAPGSFDVGVTWGTHTFPARTVQSFADELTVSFRRP